MAAQEHDPVLVQLSGENSGIRVYGFTQTRNVRTNYDGLTWLMSFNLREGNYLPQTSTVEAKRDLAVADAITSYLGRSGEQRDDVTAAIYGLVRYLRVTLADQGKNYQTEPPY